MGGGGDMSQSYDKTPPDLGACSPRKFLKFKISQTAFRPILTKISANNLYLLCHDFECLVS